MARSTVLLLLALVLGTAVTVHAGIAKEWNCCASCYCDGGNCHQEGSSSDPTSAAYIKAQCFTDEPNSEKVPILNPPFLMPGENANTPISDVKTVKCQCLPESSGGTDDTSQGLWFCGKYGSGDF